MKTIRTLFILAALMVSVGAFAQVYPDDDPFTSPGGTGSGGDGACKRCSYDAGGNEVYCESLFNAPYPGGGGIWFPVLHDSYVSCTAHNSPVGPPFCEGSGHCIWVAEWISDRHVAPRGHAENFKEQADAIASFLREVVKSDGAHVMSSADGDDFEALAIERSSKARTLSEREQLRLVEWRSKFAQLMGRELSPDKFPIMPHKPTKAPATVTASK